MKLLLLGAGRQGMRHFEGLVDLEGALTVVDPNPGAREAVQAAGASASFAPELSVVAALDEISGDDAFDAAIVSSTAAGRPEIVDWLCARGVKHMLLEKPLCQSRAELEMIERAISDAGAVALCNLYRRTLPAYQDVRARAGARDGHPLNMIVTSGAMGLGTNGVHWIDFALYLTGSSEGRLLYGEIRPTVIASGRGQQFRDYGGQGVFGFPDGSRLVLTIVPDSTAPTTFLLYEEHRMLMLDQNEDAAVVYERDPASEKPYYLYGQDYARSVIRGIEDVRFADLTLRWLDFVDGGAEAPLPSVAEAAVAHRLLFDLLETGDGDMFHIT